MDDSLGPMIRELVEPILSARQLELVELTCHAAGGQMAVRLLVDKVGGVTIQECAHANQQIGQALETAGTIQGRYTVEVSSPGLDRPLVSQRDFERAIGDELQLEVQAPNGRAQELQGMLLAVQTGGIVLKTDSGNLVLPMGHVRRAKKAMKW